MRVEPATQEESREARRRLRRATLALKLVRTMYGLAAGIFLAFLLASFFGLVEGALVDTLGTWPTRLALAALCAVSYSGFRWVRRRPVRCAVLLAVGLLVGQALELVLYRRVDVFVLPIDVIAWICVWTLLRVRRFVLHHPDAYAARWVRREHLHPSRRGA